MGSMSLNLTLTLFLMQIPLNTHVFPVFPDGLASDGTTHTTTLVMQNPNIYSSTFCAITFYGATPTLASPDGRTVRSFAIQQFLPPAGFNIMKSTSGNQLTNGYAKLICGLPITTYAIYSVVLGTTLLSQVTIPSSVGGTGFQFINDSRQGGRFALAFANDNRYATLVQVTVGDLFGRTLFVANVVVPGYSTVARFMDQIVQNFPEDHLGPIVLRSTQRIYTTGLRFTGTTVSAISPAAQLP